MKRLFIILTLLTLTCVTAHGQTDKTKIIKAFDRVTYYADSTIKAVYKIKRKKFDGYAIEFDEKGQPIAIGQYWKGKKFSWWIHPDNTYDYYSDGVDVGSDIQPSCTTGRAADFNKLYSRLLNGPQK